MKIQEYRREFSGDSSEVGLLLKMPDGSKRFERMPLGQALAVIEREYPDATVVDWGITLEIKVPPTAAESERGGTGYGVAGIFFRGSVIRMVLGQD